MTSVILSACACNALETRAFRLGESNICFFGAWDTERGVYFLLQASTDGERAAHIAPARLPALARRFVAVKPEREVASMHCGHFTLRRASLLFCFVCILLVSLYHLSTALLEEPIAVEFSSSTPGILDAAAVALAGRSATAAERSPRNRGENKAPPGQRAVQALSLHRSLQGEQQQSCSPR